MRFGNISTKLTSSITIASLAMAFVTTTHPNQPGQDVPFRLMNIERRLDQLQNRLDFLERAQQNLAMSTSAASSQRSTEAVLDLQRQQISFSEQLLILQKQMLEMQKRIDRMNENDMKSEKKEPVKEEPKAKTRSVKP